MLIEAIPKAKPVGTLVPGGFNSTGQVLDEFLAREKQNILTSQPCLHTLMQTRLSANHSARTIYLSYFINIYITD